MLQPVHLHANTPVMKKILAILLLVVTGMAAIAQQQKYQLPARQTPVTKKEKLPAVQTINDLTPLLWSSLFIPSNEKDRKSTRLNSSH